MCAYSLIQLKILIEHLLCAKHRSGHWNIAMSKADKNPCLMELTFCGIFYCWID